MKKNTVRPLALVILLMLVLLTGNTVYQTVVKHRTEGTSEEREESGADVPASAARMQGENMESLEEAETTGSVTIEKENAIPHLRDKASLYENEDESSVVTMYLTVRRGNATDHTDHSWTEINQYSAYDYEAMGVDRYQVEGLLQVGDENGPVAGKLGYGVTAPNATVQIRGQTSSENSQKNYKIRLKDNHGSWRGQQTIALNKHQRDGLRYRNKLAFDLLKDIPQLLSLRTQFVHLYVKDQTEDPANDTFRDYGLYTQVEQLNRTALKAHGLDRNGQLYKVNEFEFYRDEDTIKLESDPDYNATAFQKKLEIKGDHDHTKLIELLEEINDYTIRPEQLLNDWLDEENIAYWMAFQILMGNSDSQSRNFYIYSPKNVHRFYILPWDFDGMLFYDEYALDERSENSSWERGISNYWGNMLFRRCLQSTEFRAKLDAAIEDLRTHVLTKEHITERALSYARVVKPYLYAQPDLTYAPRTEAEYDQLTENLYHNVEEAYQSYRASLENPMPFFIGVPTVQSDGRMYIQWDPSYDLQEDALVYHASITRNSDGTDEVARYDGAWPEWTTEALPAGQYFLKVQVSDAAGHAQDAFDYYVTENGKVYGMKCFYVNADGSISEDQVEQK